MKERVTNILRAGVILMVLTVWAPTAAVLAVPHENGWVERSLETARAHTTCLSRSKFGGRYCQAWSDPTSRIDWDGWMIYGPITLGLFAALYLTAGSLSLRPQRLQDA